MMTPVKAWALAALVVSPLLFCASLAEAQVKTAKVCDDEYKAQKPALKAAKEAKKDFIAACRALPVGQPTPVAGGAPSPAPAGTKPAPAAPTAAAPGQVKTASACEAEYKENKAALKSAKETKKDFIAACRALPAGQTTPVGQATPTAAAPSASPVTTPPAPAPAAPTAAPPAPAAPAAAPAPTTRAAPPPAAGPVGANQFTNEAGAKGRCPSATVVWVNTESKVYHFAGTKNYGNTKKGAYMCETDATAAGDRASKTEKHP